MKIGTMKKRQRMIILFTLVALMMFASLVPSLAAGPGEKFGAWVQEQAIGIFIAVLAVVAIILLISRKLISAIIVFVFAGICAWILTSPLEFANTIRDMVKSWF